MRKSKEVYPPPSLVVVLVVLWWWYLVREKGYIKNHECRKDNKMNEQMVDAQLGEMYRLLAKIPNADTVGERNEIVAKIKVCIDNLKEAVYH